jgi:uncharacterized protein YfaS (alpha-2-macroglobulin family)
MNAPSTRKIFSRTITRAAAVLAMAVALAGPASAERTLERLSDFDLPGGDYRTLRNIPIEACESACLADRSCAAFTYNERASWCFLKNAVGERTPFQGAVSAIVQETDDTNPALPLPSLAFLPSDIATEAAILETRISTALRTGRQIGVVTPASATTLSGKRTADWLDFATSLLSTNYDNWSMERDARAAAGAAAYLGLRDATNPTDQGRALALLSDIMERQGLYRPSIEASAASLAFRLDAAEQERLDRLRAEYGFRTLDYTVDAEARTPRMCVQFSETLSGDAASLERFVAVDTIQSPTVSVEGSQLCVEGLEHGGRYEITVREGLPSTVGEDLRTAAEFRIYVRDRAPLARFEANRYVLPPGSEGIPVTTVNTATLDMALYRVNDRSLADVVRRGDFKRQLYSYEVSELADERGALAWEGTMAVERRTNEEVSTLFPVGEVLKTVEPGVYVLTATPAEQADDSYSVATQWFVVSDLGLVSYSNGGTVDVFIRSLSSAAPTAGVTVELLARNNELLATGTTDGDGHVRLVSTAPATGGTQPTVITAETGGDYAFLSLAGGAFELTDRGVEGRAAPGPVDAFLATERGVYRGGETVHLTTLVRDDVAKALSMPVTLKLTRPDGVLSRRIAANANSAGGLAVDLPLATNAMTGTWYVSAHVDPEGPEVGSTTFLVEDYVPQKITVDVTSDATEATAGETLAATVQADFLYGAPAGDLTIEGTVTLRAADGLAAFPGYSFGLVQEPFPTEQQPLFDLPRTAADGSATINVPIPEVSGATGPVEARIAVSVREPGGRVVGDGLTLPVAIDEPLVGIKPLFDGQVAEGARASFEVIALDGDEARTAASADWTLVRIERNFQWYRRNNAWFYESTERLEEIADGTVEITADAPGRIAVPTEWGEYRLEVATDDAQSSVNFSSGWVSADASAETPDILDVSLDKPSYAAGDTATLRIAPRHAGQALVTVLSDQVRWHALVDVPAEGASVAIPVDADWLPGAYVTATLFRPATADTGGRPLPARAIGVAWLDVDTEARRLTVAVDAPETTEPRQTVTVPVRVGGLDAGERAYLTVAAVDVGILNLTGYEAPDVDGHFLGQRALGVEVRDLYGDLIDSGGAQRGRVRSGGDGPANGTEALPPTEEPVALFTGLIETGADGTAEAAFEIPAFNGTLRVMAIAWTDEKIGDAAADMVVRDPVVVSAALPRFLAPNDATRMRVDLHNVSGPAGDYELTLATTGPIELDGSGGTVNLAANERTEMELPLAATGVGTATITATLTGPDDLSLQSDYTLVVRPAQADVSERRIVALPAGDTLTLDASILDGFDTDTVATLSIGTGDIDTPGLIAMLDRFPYGCAEQTVSRALPLLYLNEVAANVGLEDDPAIAPRIEAAITRVLNFQSSSGGFGLWSPGYDLWLTAYVMDFLTRAREAGYTVPADAFDLGLDRLQSVLSYIGDVEGERGTDVAYATYVLARNGRAAIGDLRYFAEEKIEDFDSPLARAQLGASLALAGDQALADAVFANAVLDDLGSPRPERMDFGTPLRDAAAVLTLAAESRVDAATVDDLSGLLSEVTASVGSRTLSTQEASWLILAANATRPLPGAITVNGEPLTAPLFRRLGEDELAAGVEVANASDHTLGVATTVRGTPLEPLPPVSRGLTVTRTFFTVDGEEIDPSQVRQNERLLVRIAFTKTNAAPMRLMLTDLLPAGFEVENPRLVDTSAVAALPDAQVGDTPEYTEFRDDRFAAAWTMGSGARGETAVTYMVRAVSPGTFVLPATEISDMYDPRFVARLAPRTVSITPTR